MTGTDVTVDTSMELIEIVRLGSIGIEIGTGIATASEPGTKAATIGTTIERTTAVPTEMGTNGTSIAVVVATDTLAVMIDIDLLNTGTEIGIVEDKLELVKCFFFT